jgi:hypothetical protein
MLAAMRGTASADPWRTAWDELGRQRVPTGRGVSAAAVTASRALDSSDALRSVASAEAPGKRSDPLTAVSEATVAGGGTTRALVPVASASTVTFGARIRP